MGIYQRPDSPYWWLFLEGPRRREGTNIPINGKAEEREAQERYFVRMLAYAEADTDDLLAQAIELLKERQARRARTVQTAR